MSIITRTVDYHHDGLRHEGLLAFDSSLARPLPGVLVAHTWAGRDSFATGKAQALAGLGYAAIAIDMYGEGRTGNGPGECSQLMNPLMADRPLLQARMTAALQCIRSQSEVDSQRIAAIGFCFGGLCVLDLARTGADLQGVVSFHGLFTPPDPHPCRPISASVLVLHGNDDPMATPEQGIALGQELTGSGADWQMHIYGRTMHAFTNPLANDPGFGTVYNPAADRRSWQSMKDFLAEVLK